MHSVRVGLPGEPTIVAASLLLKQAWHRGWRRVLCRAPPQEAEMMLVRSVSEHKGVSSRRAAIGGPPSRRAHEQARNQPSALGRIGPGRQPTMRPTPPAMLLNVILFAHLGGASLESA